MRLKPCILTAIAWLIILTGSRPIRAIHAATGGPQPPPIRPNVIFKMALCVIDQTAKVTSVYTEFFVNGLPAERLHAFLVYDTGEHVSEIIYGPFDERQPNLYRVNPLLSRTTMSLGLCPVALLIVSTGDQIEDVQPLQPKLLP